MPRQEVIADVLKYVDCEDVGSFPLGSFPPGSQAFDNPKDCFCSSPGDQAKDLVGAVIGADDERSPVTDGFRYSFVVHLRTT
ncbi:unnamed protein product [Haemonchus placei]|uniref:Uncharacterized protein n=1 Tax=Haemonchus placei TaxID=6290 RepID=A0A0N4VYX8_HAEPC|nr:unnamed protein product [Haemonchus placei]